MKSIIIFPFFLLFCCAYTMHAQEVITNKGGERIVQFPDGSWRYYVPGDSILLTKSPKVNVKNNTLEDGNKEFSMLNIEDKLIRRFIERLQDEISSSEEKLKDLTARRTETIDEYVQALEAPESSKSVVQILSNKKSALDHAIDKSRAIILSHRVFLQDLNRVKMADKTTKTKLLLEYNIYPDRNTDESDIDQIINTYLVDKASNIKEFREADFQINDSDKEEKSVDLIDNSQLDELEARTRPQLKEYGARLKPYNCELQERGVSEYSKYLNTIIKRDRLFTHTPEETASFLGDKDLIECYSYFSYKKGIYNLHLVFYINFPQANLGFGGFKKNSQLTIRTLDGKLLKFYSLNSSTGENIPGTQNTVYHVVFQIGKKEIKQLKKKSIDRMRVVWQAGYEDYTVYNIDLLRRQIHCLEEFL